VVRVILMKRLAFLVLLLNGVALAQSPQAPVLVTTISGISSSWPGEGPGCAGTVNNQSQASRANWYHSFAVTNASGNWSVTLQYSDTSCTGPFTPYSGTGTITQASGIPIAFALDSLSAPHKFIHIAITGNAVGEYVGQRQLPLSTALGATPTVFPWSGITGKPFYDVRDYNVAPQTLGGTLSAGVPATVNFSSGCPVGVNGSPVAGTIPFLEIANVGTPEAVQITGGTCTSGASSGTISFTPANNHAAGWTIGTQDGGVDEAIQLAAMAGGGTVIIPVGVASHAKITVPSHVTLWMTGSGSITLASGLWPNNGDIGGTTPCGTTLFQSAGDTNSCTMLQTPMGATDVHFIGGTVDWNKAGQVGWAYGSTIMLNDASYSSIENMTIQNVSHVGQMIGVQVGSAHNLVRFVTMKGNSADTSCSAKSLQATGGPGIVFVQNSSFNVVESTNGNNACDVPYAQVGGDQNQFALNNFVGGNLAAGYAFALTSGQGNIIGPGNTVSGTNTACYAYGNDFNLPYGDTFDGKIFGNSCKDSLYGALVKGAGTGVLLSRGAIVQNNTFHSVAFPITVWQNTDNVLVQGNLIDSCLYYGIDVTNGSSTTPNHVTIDNNFINHCGTGVGGPWAGINIENGGTSQVVSDITITNNTATDSYTPKTQGYGLILGNNMGTGHYLRLNVTNNNFKGNLTGSIGTGSLTINPTNYVDSTFLHNTLEAGSWSEIWPSMASELFFPSPNGMIFALGNGAATSGIQFNTSGLQTPGLGYDSEIIATGGTSSTSYGTVQIVAGQLVVGAPSAASTPPYGSINFQGNLYQNGVLVSFPTITPQAANTVFAGPVSGGSASPTFRALVSLDIPNNAANTTGTAANVTGIVAPANGGTGVANPTTHALPVAEGAGNFNFITPLHTGQILAGVGPGFDPVYTETPVLGTNGNYTGQLLIANGNSFGAYVTIQNTATTAAYNFNLPSTAGNAGQPMLSSGGGGVAMSFGTLGVPGGGTGDVTLSAHGVLVGEGTAAVNVTAVGLAGQCLTSNGPGNDPTYQPCGGGGGANTALSNLAAVSINTTLLPQSGVGLVASTTLPDPVAVLPRSVMVPPASGIVTVLAAVGVPVNSK